MALVFATPNERVGLGADRQCRVIISSLATSLLTSDPKARIFLSYADP